MDAVDKAGAQRVEAAEAGLAPHLAERLGSRDLYLVELGGVAGKYIGETEKNLAGLFRWAASAGAVLLFDEADAVLGKRSEVRDSHDRFANFDAGDLVHLAEESGGVVFLASNRKSNLDGAFMRRIRFIVEFSGP